MPTFAAGSFSGDDKKKILKCLGDGVFDSDSL